LKPCCSSRTIFLFAISALGNYLMIIRVFR
jgi:hypothetical protein